MTAEIAVLNKIAVTLAADSAVTIGTSDGFKVYNSADKIFEATTFDPIGIMVYNSPELSGVPVEAIVKMYRDQHCPGQFETVFDFADAFLRYIETFTTPDHMIKVKVWDLISNRASELHSLMRELTEEFFRAATTEKYPSVDKLVEALEVHLNLVLDCEIERLIGLPLPSWAEDLSIDEVLNHHGAGIREYLDLILEIEDLPEERKGRLITVLAWSLLKEWQPNGLTGLVFAGFGRTEIFPSLFSVEVYGTIAGKLKHARQVRFDVDRSLTPDAAAYPFAQKEMVDRFMYGLDGEFLELCTSYFTGALGSLKGHLNQHFEALGDDVRVPVDPAVDAIVEEFQRQIVPDHLSRLRNRFSDMIRSMPKQELAALAESLVHITSLKRKFSAGAESVGGPIDVAVITRAEGFVWVKRKHYFDPSLNPRYFFRRYGGNNTGSPPACPKASSSGGM